MDLRKQRTLKLLSGALVDKLREKPYEDITVGEICEAAMVRRATFYRHFSGKDDLLAYVVHVVREDWKRRLAIECAAPAELASKLTAELSELVVEHDELLRRQRLSPAFSSVVLTVADAVSDELTPAIERSMVDKGVPPDAAPLKAQMTAHFYVAGLASAMRWWLTDHPELSSREFLEMFSGLVSRVLG